VITLNRATSGLDEWLGIYVFVRLALRPGDDRSLGQLLKRALMPDYVNHLAMDSHWPAYSSGEPTNSSFCPGQGEVPLTGSGPDRGTGELGRNPY
jgi:hypothetical protein